MVKFIFAPDSFKGSLNAVEICTLLTKAAQRHFPGAITCSIPVADGGEGTVDALVLATRGKHKAVTATGPMGNRVCAAYGIMGNGETAVVEMAQASGLPLAPKGRRNPMHATSLGTGEVIRQVLDQGYQKLLIGIGGSATNDGGMGLLTALGARFTDAEGAILRGSGAELGKAVHVDFSAMHPRLSSADIRVLCDVNNPLLGDTGATYVYSPQKGADAAMLPVLESGMVSYAALLEKATGRSIASLPGAGAAGGVGAALVGVLGATLAPGINAVLDAVDFDGYLEGASLVITGEGRLDEQSIRFGKVPAGVAARCKQQGVPVIALVGGMAGGAEALYEMAEASIMTTINAAMPIGDAMKNAVWLYESAADRMFRMLKIGMGL